MDANRIESVDIPLEFRFTNNDELKQVAIDARYIMANLELHESTRKLLDYIYKAWDVEARDS